MPLKAKLPGNFPQRSHKGKEEALELVQKENTKRLNVIIPESVYKRFRKKSVMDDTTMTTLVKKWIDEYLKT
jgi:hypothetical protein